MSEALRFLAMCNLALLVLIGIKSVLVGQFWPWQFKGKCPHCKRPWKEPGK